ncbi:MAG: hypothetical protein H7832_00965 [Magnetococcus sp. DMHC-6]
MTMPITRMEIFSAGALLSQLKKTRLRGFGQPYVYADAQLTLIKNVDPAILFPAQRYVLKSDYERLRDLYEQFMERSVNIFALEGVVLFWQKESQADSEEEGPIPLTPPVVEISREPDGRLIPLINDGMHRVYTALKLGQTINIVLAKNVPEVYPYYAFALEKGWEEVVELEELPDQFIKKNYRDPDNYKALFRDFNEVFPGIQKQRKQSNPGHIRA